MSKFQAGQVVRGNVCGRFIVIKVETKQHVGEVLTVKELGPNGEQSTQKMRFPAEMMYAE